MLDENEIKKIKNALNKYSFFNVLTEYSFVSSVLFNLILKDNMVLNPDINKKAETPNTSKTEDVAYTNL